MSDPRTAPIRTFNWGDWEDMVAERDAALARVREWEEWYGTEVPSDEYCNSLAQSKAHVASLEALLRKHGIEVPK